MSLTASTRSTWFVTGLALHALLLSASACLASPITYTVNQAIGAGSVMGTIQTDGKTGILSSGDITGFNLTLNGPGATYTITGANSVVQVTGIDLTATATNLLFNFSGADDGYLLFQQALFSGMHYYCDAAATDVCFQGATVTPQSIFDPSAQNVPESGSQIIGTVAAVPEPASVALLGLSLAIGGLVRRGKQA